MTGRYDTGLNSSRRPSPSRRSMPHASTLVLGAGMTGLAAASVCDAVVLEREPRPGGICTSYYVRPETPGRLPDAPVDGEAYRFEIGGGHWIFGGAPHVLAMIDALAPLERHARRSSVYFRSQDRYAGFPIQHNLRDLGEATAAKALAEIVSAQPGNPRTMAEWLERSFGPTLCSAFFAPFQAAYTAGLWTRIAPQDGYKTPVSIAEVERGARGLSTPAGYNVTFAYPRGGLDAVARSLAARCDVRYGTEVLAIDASARTVALADGTTWSYDRLFSTLPLDRTLAMSKLDRGEHPDPSTGVMVLNLGARRGPACPNDHWIYLPESEAGMHRVGCYDNVADHFLPSSRRGMGTHVALYVERAFAGDRPPMSEQRRYVAAAIEELSRWGWIANVEASDLTVVDCAYTWSWPGSRWRERAIDALEKAGVQPIGRYGRWRFQGIAESIGEGLAAGTAVRESR